MKLREKEILKNEKVQRKKERKTCKERKNIKNFEEGKKE